MTTTKHDDATQAWLDARAEVFEIGQRIASAVRDRPKYGTKGYDAYQASVVAPLIAERNVARLAAEHARRALHATRQAVQQ